MRVDLYIGAAVGNIYCEGGFKKNNRRVDGMRDRRLLEFPWVFLHQICFGGMCI